jgi:periplasmic copper chaperone A
LRRQLTSSSTQRSTAERNVLRQSFLAAVSAVCLGASAQAQTPPTPAIQVEAPWLRATPKGAPVVGGYATITNRGATPDRLVGATIPVAAEAQVHTMSMANGVMHMQQLNDGLAIPPGATVTLAPGGNHLMFRKPSRPLKEGETIQGSLRFEKAGAIPVIFAVGGMAAKVAPGAAGPHAGKSTSMPGMKMD